MRPGPLNLTIYKGASFRERWVWQSGNPPTPVPFPAGSRATATLRINGVVVMRLDSDASTNPDGPIVLDPVDGSITPSAPDDVIAALPEGSGTWVLVVRQAGADAKPLLEGELTIIDTGAE